MNPNTFSTVDVQRSSQITLLDNKAGLD